MRGKQFRVYHKDTGKFEILTLREGYNNDKCYLISDFGLVYDISETLSKITEKNIAKYLLSIKTDCDDVTTWDGNKIFGRKIFTT